jgi:nucleotide-binding universal stress UspA family protein
MAQHFKAKVTLLNVIQVPVGWYAGVEGAYPIAFDIDAMMADGRKQLETFFGSPDLGLTVDPVVCQGDPATEITAYAEAHDVGLIMMPTHGYGKFRGLLLGSVTAKVLYDAKCAVWTAAHTEDPKFTGDEPIRSILCAVDQEPESVGLICYSNRLARSFQAQLRLVHAVPRVEGAAERFVYPDFMNALFENARTEISGLQKQAGTDLELCLDGGKVSKVVRAAVEEHNADLVVIGRGKLHETFGRLRTDAYSIIRESPCSVLSA